jgi:hypothetical protein
MSVVTGTVAFANLDQHEIYQGQSTGKYSIVLTLDESGAEQLQKEGVNVKMYNDNPQRKFATKFDEFPVIDNDGEPVSKSSVRYGDKVRIKYDLGAPHPVHGTTVYLKAVRVVEKGEAGLGDDEDF